MRRVLRKPRKEAEGAVHMRGEDECGVLGKRLVNQSELDNRLATSPWFRITTAPKQEINRDMRTDGGWFNLECVSVQMQHI